MASSGFNNQVARVTECYPYPSNLSAASSFMSVKLSGTDNYHMWEAQMQCLLKSHGMFGFTRIPDSRYDDARKMGGENYRLWQRSDEVVKGWILGSLSDETLRYVLYRLSERRIPRDHVKAAYHADFDAVHLWNELHSLCTPHRPLLDLPQEYETQAVEMVQQNLHQAIVQEDWDEVYSILSTGELTVLDKITNNGNTALHVAASTTKIPKLLQKLLEMLLLPHDKQLRDLKNSEGSTPLHVAAIVGNTQAAEILVNIEADLLLARNYMDQTPLDIALSNMDTKMCECLVVLANNTDRENDSQSAKRGGDALLATLISSKDFRLALDLVERFKKFTGHVVLMAIAQNFPDELNIVEKYIGTSIMGSSVEKVLNSVRDDMVKRCVPFCGSWMEILFSLFFAGIYGIIMFFPLIAKMLAWPFIKKRVRIRDDAMQLLSKVCTLIKDMPWHPSGLYYETIIEATRQNAYDVVECIVRFFPSTINSRTQDHHNIIEDAVINRSENVYNLLYQMGEHKNVYRTIKDPYQNNLLHLAGRLAPANKLDLISGEFLQIQRELQWFKEVQRFVSPLNVNQKNFFNETPQMVFTREHKDLVIEGEKWLKSTAESYTITAALITTIVFAAAITVPGGNNQDTGIPVFTNKTAFAIFAISDAISLFAAITSLLMFMSILTARYAEQDFLFKLPTKLIIGLGTLFVSTTSMIIASGATLYLVFGQSNYKILITIIVFTCLPIAVFVTLQARLVIDLMSATYGRSIFGKKRDRPFY